VFHKEIALSHELGKTALPLGYKKMIDSYFKSLRAVLVPAVQCQSVFISRLVLGWYLCKL